MEAIIPGTEMEQLGNGDDPLFSFSQFDLDLQQQAQAAIQQQQQQLQPQQHQDQPQRSVPELWEDFDRYLPLDCQSFVMTEPTTMNASTSTYSALNNDMSNLHFESTTGTTSSNNLDPTTLIHSPWSPQDTVKQEYYSSPGHSGTTSSNNLGPTTLIHSPWSPQDTVKQEYYSSPGHYSDTSSPLQHPDIMSSLSVTPQQTSSTNNTSDTTNTPTSSQPLLPLTSNPEVAELIAGINWNLPVSPPTDSNKIPIHRLKPASEIQTSPSSSTTASGGAGKQKKTAHNAIERRYRNNINDRITELKNAVPALLHAKLKDKDGIRATGGSNNKRSNVTLDEDDDDMAVDDGEEYLDGVAVATKLNKATILHKATEYIHHLKRTNNDKKMENDALQHLLAQLPGGPQVLAQYQVRKLQREQMMQQQLALERQWMKQDQQNRKKAAAANKRKRANRSQLTYNNNDDFFDNGSLSSEHPNTPPSDHDAGLANNRVFLALFMAIAFFSSSPLTTSAGSEQVNSHNHLSRTTSEQLIIDASTLNTTDPFISPQHTLNNDNTFWIPWMDGWYILRASLFIICMIQLLSPYIKTWAFAHSFKIRRFRSATRPRRPLRNEQQHTKNDNVNNNSSSSNNNKTTDRPPSMTPGDEKCTRMTQLLARSIAVDHNDTSITLSPKNNKFGFLSALTKELVLFTARHVFGYIIITSTQDQYYGNDDDSDWEQQDSINRWKHAFKWVKLNECECLGGNPFLSRLGLIYHSVRMLNLVDTLQDDDENEQQQQQLLSMRARAYATATMQLCLGLPCTYFANRVTDYLWRMAMNDANEQDPWTSLIDDDDDDDDETPSNMMTILSTKSAWMETLDVIKNQMPSAKPSDKNNALDLTLSAYAPTLVPTMILSNLHLLDRLTLNFQTLIDNMMTTTTTTTPNPTDISLSSVFPTHPHSVKDDTTRVANWFACVGATVEALWQGDTIRAEQGMLALTQHVPRAMTAPIHRRALKKKERQSELDAMAKQQVVHMLAGATLVLQKQDSAGIKELEIGERFRHQRTKRLLVTNELEATHVEGRVMALAEFAVMLVTLKAWIAAVAWQSSFDNDEMAVDDEETKDTQVRLVALSLRRMVCRPALAGRFKTQQVMIDRLDKLGRYVEEASLGLDDNDHPYDSANGFSDDGDDGNNDFVGDINNKRSDEIKQETRIHKMMAIIQGT